MLLRFSGFSLLAFLNNSLASQRSRCFQAYDGYWWVSLLLCGFETFCLDLQKLCTFSIFKAHTVLSKIWPQMPMFYVILFNLLLLLISRLYKHVWKTEHTDPMWNCVVISLSIRCAMKWLKSVAPSGHWMRNSEKQKMHCRLWEATWKGSMRTLQSRTTRWHWRIEAWKCGRRWRKSHIAWWIQEQYLTLFSIHLVFLQWRMRPLQKCKVAVLPCLWPLLVPPRPPTHHQWVGGGCNHH